MSTPTRIRLPSSGYLESTADSPIIETVMPTELTEEWLRAYTEAIKSLLRERSGSYLTLHDCRPLTSFPSAKARSAIADMRRDLDELAGSRCQASALIVSNGILLGMFRAIAWLAPSPYPTKAFGERSEALTFLWGQWKG